MMRRFSALSYLLPYLWRRDDNGKQWTIALSLCCLFIAKLFSSATPLAYKGVIDHFGVHAVVAVPIGLISAYGLARLLSSLFEDLRDALFERVGQGATRQLNLRVFRKLHDLGMRFHLERETGGLARTIDRGTQAVATLLWRVLFSIVPLLVEIALVCGILWYFAGLRFGLVTLVTIVLYAVFTISLVSWRTRYRRALNELNAEVGKRTIDSLLNFETVKHFGNEEYEAERLDESLTRLETVAIRSKWTFTALSFGQSLIISVGLVAVTVMAADRIAQNTMTIGELVLVNAYLLQLYQPLNMFGVMYREIRQALVDLENIVALIQVEPEITDRADATSLDLIRGELCFREVTFAYDRRKPVLQGISFTVPAGQTVAVVGATGSGKSTLYRLLLRFFEVDSGAIFVDGQDIRSLTQASLRAAFGIVPQDAVLFNDTLRYNIAYGRPGASEDDIIAAARSAHIHDFIAGLPDGYDTRVGERGLKLSGGEKQRVAIARTVLKGARILVFDEATSALDTATERQISLNLREISRGVTTLVIAHRLSTIVDSDQIMVIDDGRIVEAGSHGDLLAKDGDYARMWRHQGREVDYA